MQIHLSDDRAMYHVTCEDRESRYWLGVKTVTDKGTPSAEKLAHHRRFAGWLNVETKRHGRYYRPVYALEIPEVKVGEHKFISEQTNKFKDYALFHKWPI